MSLLFKGVPIPTLIAIVLLIIAGIFAIIGLATPNWHDELQRTSISTTQTLVAHHGIWAKCSLRRVDTFDCGAHSEEKEFLLAVRAMEILAVLFGAACIILTGIWAFLKIEKNRQILAISYMLTGFLAGLFGIIGIIIYAAEIGTADSSGVPGISIDYQLSWSFALTTLAACSALIATALLGVGWRMLK